MGGRRRDSDGLTDKQKQAIPIIARAKSRHQGILECERLGIVRQSHYYNRWVKEPVFVEKLEEERRKYFEEVRNRVMDVFVAYAELLAQRLVSFGLQDGRDRLRAIENVLTAVGIEFGKGQKVDVKTNVVQTAPEEDFVERLKRLSRERYRAFGEDNQSSRLPDETNDDRD
jgi:hypothetical protein